MNRHWLLAILAAAMFFVGCEGMQESSGQIATGQISSATNPAVATNNSAAASASPSANNQTPVTAETITFDPAASDLQSTTLQTALVEINEKINSTNEAVALLQGNASCPSGMTKVFQQFCIDNNERATTNYDNAIKTCGLEGKLLCTTAQFYTTCTQNTLFPAVINLKNNYEWSKDLQFSYDSYADKYEMNATRIGYNSCTAVTYHANFANLSVKAPYRCCTGS